MKFPEDELVMLFVSRIFIQSPVGPTMIVELQQQPGKLYHRVSFDLGDGDTVVQIIEHLVRGLLTVASRDNFSSILNSNFIMKAFFDLSITGLA